MCKTEQSIFREALRCLPFCGTSIRDFAEQISISPHTIYNYICGQKPAEKNYRYILYTLERSYPQALKQGMEIATKEEKQCLSI